MKFLLEIFMNYRTGWKRNGRLYLKEWCRI